MEFVFMGGVQRESREQWDEAQEGGGGGKHGEKVLNENPTSGITRQQQLVELHRPVGIFPRWCRHLQRFSAYVLLGNDGGVLAGLPSLSGPGMMDREKLIWPFRWRIERETERPRPQPGP